MAYRDSSRRFHRPVHWRSAWLLAAALVLVIAGCGSDSETEQTEGEQPTAGSTTEVTAETDPADDDQQQNRQEDAGSDQGDELFPDVIDASASLESGDIWTFSATLSSPYDTPARYADAWRVTGPDGEVYGIRELTHDHQTEQPFTRSQSGIQIPDDVSSVTVEGRDQLSGWGGATVEVVLER